MVKSRGRLGSRKRSRKVPPTRLSYRAIAEDLAERISRGEYPPGSQLPSYRQLAEIYSCSVTTAQSALRLLRERGLTNSQPGRGVYVAEPDT